MPIAGTQNILGAARIAAENVVKAKWAAAAAGRALTPSELAQMQLEMKVADSAAIIVHLTANGLVIGGVTSGAGFGGIVTGTIT
jgi:hypothetical protein